MERKVSELQLSIDGGNTFPKRINFSKPNPYPLLRQLSDIDARSFSRQRQRSTTEPDLSASGGSHEDVNGSKKSSRGTAESSPRGFPLGVRPVRNQAPDIRWLQSGNSSRDGRHFAHEDGDVYNYRNTVYTNVNEVPRSSPLVKSPSASQLHFTRNSSASNVRATRYTVARPSSVTTNTTNFSLPPPYASKASCSCCDGSKKTTRAESVLSLADDPETPEGLSWRRLHMSRAKLKATATTSELLSGFAMVAMVELQINKPTAVPEWLFVTFAVCTTILVSVHIFALMISTYLLPSIDAVSKLHVSSLVTESPHDRMKSFIELAWAFSTILGLLLFLIEIAILCWVKFWDYSFTAAMSATMIVIPVLIVFVAFAMHFYHSLVVIKCKTSVMNIEELENMKKQLDSVA